MRLAASLAAVALVLIALVLLVRRPAPQTANGSADGESAAGATPTPASASSTAAVPSPATALPSPRAASDPVVVRASWGAGPGQLGHKRDPEAPNEGPMSLTVDAQGNLVVLDQVNRRLTRFSRDGRPLVPIPIDADTVQEIALTRSGNLVLMDRLAERSLTFYDERGRRLGEVALEGRGIPEGGGTTALFVDRDDRVYVEREHTEVLRVADGSGRPSSERVSVPGRPSRDGRVFYRGAIADRRAGTVDLQAFDADARPLWRTTVPLGAPILYLSLLESDGAGNLYLGGHTGHESATPPYRIVDERLVLLSLSPAGTSRGTLVLGAAPPSDEAFRELTVAEDGTVYRMVRTEKGVAIEAYRF